MDSIQISIDSFECPEVSRALHSNEIKRYVNMCSGLIAFQTKVWSDSQRLIVTIITLSKFIDKINRWLMVLNSKSHFIHCTKHECSSIVQDSIGPTDFDFEFNPYDGLQCCVEANIFFFSNTKKTCFTSNQIIDQKFHIALFLCCSHWETVSCVTACP